jgi:hypothetical protein
MMMVMMIVMDSMRMSLRSYHKKSCVQKLKIEYGARESQKRGMRDARERQERGKREAREMQERGKSTTQEGSGISAIIVTPLASVST